MSDVFRHEDVYLWISIFFTCFTTVTMKLFLRESASTYGLFTFSREQIFVNRFVKFLLLREKNCKILKLTLVRLTPLVAKTKSKYFWLLSLFFSVQLKIGKNETIYGLKSLLGAPWIANNIEHFTNFVSRIFNLKFSLRKEKSQKLIELKLSLGKVAIPIFLTSQ